MRGMLGGIVVMFVVMTTFVWCLRRSYRQLRQYKSNQQAILDTLFKLGLVSFYDLQSHIHYLNPSLQTVLGKHAQDLLGKMPMESNPEAQAYHAKIETVIRTGHDDEMELALSDIDEDLRHHHIRFVAERSSDGEMIGVLALGHDVTEARRLQNTLKKYERQWRTFSENIPDFIFRLDGQDRCLYFSPGIIKAFNMSVEHYAGKTAVQIGITGNMASDLALLDSALNGMHEGLPNMLEMTFRHQYGNRVLDNVCALERGESGNTETVLAVRTDSATRKSVEEYWIKSEPEFRTLVENCPNRIARYDLNCRRVYFNQAYIETEIKVRVNAMGKTPLEYWRLDEPTAKEYTERLLHVMETGEPEELLAVQFDKEGSPVSYATSLVPEFNEKNQVVSVLAIGYNITELKKTERKLEESKQMLRQLTARVETSREDERKYLSRELHDELGQYLMALRMGVLFISLNFGENNPELKEKTNRVIEIVDSTIEVVRNVVVCLRPKSLDFGIVAALEWLVDDYQVRTEIPCELDVVDEDIFLDDTHATAIFRIVQESLTNIGRHAKASKVDIVLERRKSQYVLQVRDNGKGFDPAVINDKSFGLVGMRERALMLGGEVEISSVLGHGTVISVSMPVNNYGEVNRND